MSEHPPSEPRAELAELLAVVREIAGSLRGIHHELAALRAAGPPVRPPSGPTSPVSAPALSPPPSWPQAQPVASRPASLLAAALDQAGAGTLAAETGLRTAGTPTEEARAVAVLLERTDPDSLPEAFLDRLRDWACAQETAALEAGLETFAAELSRDWGVTPQLRLGEAADLPGLKLRDRDRPLLAPVLFVRSSPTARLALSLWEVALPPWSWEDLRDFARGALPADDRLLALLDWADGQSAGRRSEVLRTLAPLGVRVVDQPDEADPELFRRLLVYRSLAGDEVLERAVVVEKEGSSRRILRQGRVRGPAPGRPSPLDFMRSEQQTLVDDVDRAHRAFVRLHEVSPRSVDAETIRGHLQQYIDRYQRGVSESARRLQAEGFGSFVQEVLRVCPEPHDNPGADWEERQRAFRLAAEPLLRELGLQTVFANPGHKSHTYRDRFYQLYYPPPDAKKYKPGDVTDGRAPALVYAGNGPDDMFVLKGTLYAVPF